MSECQNKGINPVGCEHCTCGHSSEPKPGRVPWLMVGLVLMLGFALLFTQVFSRGGGDKQASTFDKTGISLSQTEGKP